MNDVIETRVPSRYARCIGRVGGLAVLLGVGAAIATGFSAGTAIADTGATKATSERPSASSNEAPSNDTDTDTGPASANDDDEKADEKPAGKRDKGDGEVDAPDEDPAAEEDPELEVDEPEEPAAADVEHAAFSTENVSDAVELTDSEEIVTGLFREVLREDPTESELLRYTTLLDRFGADVVVRRLYNSTAFREDQVDAYYLELLGRDPSESELKRGTFLLKIGLPETHVIARIAGTREFYTESGGTAASFVNLLYRNLLGRTADKDEAPVYVQQVLAGRSLRWVATQFVRSDDFRAVKVDETFQIVLGRDATDEELVSYVSSWFYRGGQAGIAKSLLAGDENMIRVQSSQIELPDPVAVAQLEELLRARYTEDPDGFVATFNRLIQWTPTGESCEPQEVCNTALYELLSVGGFTREMPNESIVITPITGETTTLRPSQNEIGVEDSLEYPLTKPDKLKDYLKGGAVLAKSVILTANDGTTIVDGHHRWAGLYVVNPYTQIYSNDLGYAPNPMEALKETQIAIGAQLGYLPTQQVSGPNMYTIGKDDFFDAVEDIIESGDDADEVMNVFDEEAGLDSIKEVQEYLWQNVLRMRQFNQPVAGAPGRGVMPQPPDVTEMFHLMEGGGLIYTLPAQAYLG